MLIRVLQFQRVEVLLNDLEKAQGESEKCKSKIESRKDPGEEMLLNYLTR